VGSLCTIAQNLSIRNQITVEQGGGVTPRVLAATADGGVVIAGDRGGKRESGGEIWVARLAPSLKTVWRAALQVGAPLPSSYVANAIFEAPDGAIYLLANRSACLVDGTTGRCILGRRESVSEIIRIQPSGELAWIQPLECRRLGCSSGILLSAFAQPDGLMLMRTIAIPPTEIPGVGKLVRVLQKVSWQGKTEWESEVEDIRGLPTRMLKLDSGLVFGEIGAGDAVSFRVVDGMGRLEPAISSPIRCRNGGFFKLTAEFSLFCSTDDHAGPGAMLGGRFLRLIPRSASAHAESAVKEISAASLVADAPDGWVFIGSVRDQLGGRPVPAATYLSRTGPVSARLRFTESKNASTVVAASSTRPNEYFASYGVPQRGGKPGESRAVLVRISAGPSAGP
jgi:hypothetical protein